MSSGSDGWRFASCHMKDHGYTGVGSVTEIWTPNSSLAGLMLATSARVA